MQLLQTRLFIIQNSLVLLITVNSVLNYVCLIDITNLNNNQPISLIFTRSGVFVFKSMNFFGFFQFIKKKKKMFKAII